MSEEQDTSLTLTEHLKELRSRMFWSIFWWFLASCLCYYFVPYLLDFVRDTFLNKNVQLIFTRPTEAFIAYIKVAMVAGLFLASPVLLYHVIMFVAPGLKANEKKWVLRLVPVSGILFCLGVTFAFFVVLPVTMHFFLSFQTEALNPMFQVGDFLGFVTGILALCGASFQLATSHVLRYGFFDPFRVWSVQPEQWPPHWRPFSNEPVLESFYSRPRRIWEPHTS